MKNKCIIVTGAAHGIGWAISQHLADLGAHVVGLARDTQDIDFPGRLYTCDFSQAGQTEELLRMLREKYPVDAVVNYVAASSVQTVGNIELADLYTSIDTQVRVAVQMAQVFVPDMKTRKAGRIVNITHVAAHGLAGMTSYAAANGAVLSCTKTWAEELANDGITANAVSFSSLEAREPEQQEVAAAVAFFLSEAATHITGQELIING